MYNDFLPRHNGNLYVAPGERMQGRYRSALVSSGMLVWNLAPGRDWG